MKNNYLKIKKYLAPNPHDTAIHSKNIKNNSDIPLAAYSSKSWKTYIPP